MSDKLLHAEMKELLSSFLRNAFSMNSNDPLANVLVSGVIPFDEQNLSSTPDWEKLIRTAKNSEKEFGLNPLCKATGVVQLNWNNKEYHFPLFLEEIKLMTDKLSNQIRPTICGDQKINPFLIHFFDKQLQLKIPEQLTEIEPFFAIHPTINIDFSKQFIGSFHPHRYEIIRDIENLVAADSYSFALKQLLGVEEQADKVELPLSISNLVSADPDQLHVLGMISESNCLVQGPPGTGKSQVIINLLGKLIEAKESTVVVSEKRVALDVIHKKMSALGIGGFCFTTTSHFSNTHFVSALKKEWMRIEENSFKSIKVTNQHSLQKQELQNILNLLHQPGLVSGIKVIELLNQIDLENKSSVQPYSSSLPTLEEWKNIKQLIEYILEHQLSDIFVCLKPELIEKSYLLSIESNLTNWKKAIDHISKEENQVRYIDIYQLARKALIFSKFETQLFRKFNRALLSNPINRKKIEKKRSELIKQNVELEKLELENNHWIKLPNEAEATELINYFKQKGFFQGVKQKMIWKTWTRSPFLDPITCFQLRLNQLRLKNKYQEILASLAIFGIENTSDLEEALTLIRSISPEEVSLFEATPPEKIKFYNELHPLLNKLITDFQLYFQFDDAQDLIHYLNELERNLHLVLAIESKLQGSSRTIPFLLKNYKTISEMEKAILHSAWSKVKIDFPKLTDFSWDEIYNKTQQSIKTEQQENEEFAHFLLHEQKKQFEYYSSVLRAPMQKLSTEEKALKQQLKNGKRILIKEFSKSRNHSSIRDLMDSDAQVWIQLLKPIWLVNPARMATCFPLKQSLFKVAIFDEASQIPFEHALGTLQRVNRILVAGDPQQMSPSNYFSSNTESVDLLHQAHYYLPSHFLSYHYRSQHPALIAFSNRNFYENRLIAFQHASYKGIPIDFQYVKDGVFENNVNKIEAEKVAAYISSRIDSRDSLGIAAFSESQLACIYSFLSSDIRIKLHQRIELDEVFFKAVENIQGDECDELIISFGYGFTENDGVFSMRFGPINFSSGPKRLNVLFSRARKKISFFASVQAKDFKPHHNEAVELLRKWFLQMEDKYSMESEAQLSISFKSLVESNSNALIINTLLSVYQEREWIINLK